MNLEQTEKVEGIKIATLSKYQFTTIAQLIYSGEPLQIFKVNQIITGNLFDWTKSQEGSVFEVYSPSLDYQSLLVRLANAEAIVSEEYVKENSPFITFRCGDNYGLFVYSDENELLGYSTELSEIEVVGLFD